MNEPTFNVVGVEDGIVTIYQGVTLSKQGNLLIMADRIFRQIVELPPGYMLIRIEKPVFSVEARGAIDTNQPPEIYPTVNAFSPLTGDTTSA